jgi:hypothetical protein
MLQGPGTEFVKAKELAEVATRAKSAFLAMVAATV